MTSPLQVISTSETERTIIYQTYMRETIVIVQQQRERIPSPINHLACRPSDQEYRDRTTQRHLMLPNYLLDQITLLRQSRKSFFDSSTETEFCPALDKTDINNPGYLEQSPRKIIFRNDCETIFCTKSRKGTVGTWQSVHPIGTSSQRRQYPLLRTQLQT